MSLTIRKATAADTPTILRFIRELAEYEKLSHEVTATEETLRASLFAVQPKAHALIAEIDGMAAGFAVYFYNFSTFLGRNGIYIEDIYVSPDKRGGGIGKALFEYLAAQVVAEGYGRLEWSVLDWNKPAIDFYQRMNAKPMSEWVIYRLQGESLDRMGKKDKDAA